MSVLLPDPLDPTSAVVDPAGDAKAEIGRPPGLTAFLPGREIIGERDLDHREGGIEEAAIDHLALAGAVAVAQCRQGADRRVQ